MSLFRFDLLCIQARVILYDLRDGDGQHHAGHVSAGFFHNIIETNHSLSRLRSRVDEMMIVEEHRQKRIYLTLRGIVITEVHFFSSHN